MGGWVGGGWVDFGEGRETTTLIELFSVLHPGQRFDFALEILQNRH